MDAWMIMLGCQFTMVIVSAIWVGIWMTRPKDEYDLMLDKMNELANEKKAAAKK